MTKPRTNWSSTPRGARKRPILEGMTIDREVYDALHEHCERTGEKKSDVVERLLRKEFGMETRR